MEKCIICNKSTDNHILYAKDRKSKRTPQYVCEECMWESINKDKAKFKIKYEKALRYLKKNNYKVIVTGYDADYREEFEINHNVMECVDIIRKRMEEQNFQERWIDVDWKTYENCKIEVVTYLYFAKYSETELDEYGDFEIKEEQAFWFELTNVLST